MVQIAKIDQLLQSFSTLKRGMMKGGRPQLPNNISQAQFEILIHIKKGTSRVADLASTMHTSASAATQHVNHLVAAGYIERQAANDRRETHLILTEQGKSILDAHRQVVRKQMAAVLLVLSDEEIDEFIRIIDKINSQIQTK